LASLFGNPVDLARISGLLVLGGATIFGAAGIQLERGFGSSGLAILALSAAALLWNILVLILAGWRLGKKEI
jgi:hypothetical protein